MAASDKNILISPQRGSTTNVPSIVLTGDGNDPLTISVLDGTPGSLSVEGSAGQLFSVTNNLTVGSIFSVNDVSGIPSLNIDADGTVSMGVFGGNVGIGTASPTTKLQVVGTITATAFSGPLTGNATTATTWATGRTIALTGDVTGTSVAFNGSANLSFAATLINSGVTAGTYTSVTVDAKGRVTAGSSPATPSGALSNSTTSTQSGYFGNIFLFDDVSPSHYLGITNSADLTAARTLSLNVNNADRTISLSGNLTVSAIATISGTNTGDQTITLTGDVTGTGTGSFATTLANSGVAASTYRSVTVDVKGRVTAGTNPTTLAGYGITDAVPSSRALTIAGTTNQVTVSLAGAQNLTANRSWTLSLPQNIHTAATPTFGGLTVNGNLGIRAAASASVATQIPIFTADPASTTRTLVTRTPAQLRGDIGAVAKAGDTLTGFLTLHAAPTANLHAATKQYVDGILATNDAMVFKGTLGTGGTYTALPTTHGVGWTIRVITAGTYAGQVAEIGDMYVSLVTRAGSGNVNADWTLLQTNIDGAVVGPASATDNHVALFNGTSGKVVKSSGVVLGNGTLTVNTSGTGLSGNGTFTANQNTNGTITITSNATNANTANAIVARDASGNFSAGTITAALSGNATTATNATSITGTTTAAIVSSALGSGTADNTTFLRGDRAWATISVSSEFTLSGSCGTIYSSEAGNGGTGTNNFFAGFQAGQCNTTGSHNNFFGNCAGRSNTTGSFNNFIGNCAGRCNTTGGFNNFFGNFAGCNNTAGSNNNFFGSSAGCSNTTGNNNNFFGCWAGYYSTTGFHNNFFGNSAGLSNTTGFHNNFFGHLAGRCNTTGGFNNFFGNSAGLSSTTGFHNNFFGSSAGLSNTTGFHNNFFGSSAGYYNTAGSNNNFIGCYAGRCNTTGSNNNFIGSSAGRSNTTGGFNNFFGRYAGFCNTTGSFNNFFGDCAGRSNTAGCNNNFFGYYAGGFNTTGNNNNFFGCWAGYCNTTGFHNNFFGNCAGRCNTTGSYNTFIGNLAGRDNTTGSNNNFIGKFAGVFSTTGSFNNFFGNLAGRSNTTGTNNNFFGCGAGYCNTTGSFNNFFGCCAGYCNTTGSHNNFFGQCAGRANTTGSYNTFIGNLAGRDNTTGCFNNFFGNCAGRGNTTGSNNLFFGCLSGVGATGLCNVTTQSHHIIMGNSSHTNALIQINWTTISDCRDKCIFGDVPHGRGFLQNITPIEYALKDRETGCLKDEEGKRRYGFSAQNVLEAEGNSPVIVNANDLENLKITSDYMIPVLVNAVKELSEEVETLKSRVSELENI